MKITASRADDLRKEREAYMRDKEVRTERYADQALKYGKARQTVYDRIEDELRSHLDKFDKLQFDIEVWGSGPLNIRVECDERRKFEDACPLSWSYHVDIPWRDEGVRKETNSWSGLKATTPEHIESLRQTVDALEYLNSVDWDKVIHTPMPESKDFISEKDPRYDTYRDWDTEIFEAELSDHIGKDEYIRGKRGDWIRIDKETPQFYVYARIPSYYFAVDADPDAIRRIEDAVRRVASYTERIRKDKIKSLMDTEDLTVKSLDELIEMIPKSEDEE